MTDPLRKRSESDLDPEDQRARWRTPHPDDDDFENYDMEDARHIMDQDVEIMFGCCAIILAIIVVGICLWQVWP